MIAQYNFIGMHLKSAAVRLDWIVFIP